MEEKEETQGGGGEKGQQEEEKEVTEEKDSAGGGVKKEEEDEEQEEEMEELRAQVFSLLLELDQTREDSQRHEESALELQGGYCTPPHTHSQTHTAVRCSTGEAPAEGHQEAEDCLLCDLRPAGGGAAGQRPPGRELQQTHPEAAR